MERGTSCEQDARFSDKMKKLAKSLKFPKNFSKKVNLKKINLTVFRPWVTRRISEMLGVDDDIVIEFALGILEQEMAQIQLTGFLEKNAAIFVEELWELLLNAQENSNGIPTKFIEEKKEELRKKKIEEEKIARRIERERKIESEAREQARAKRNQVDKDGEKETICDNKAPKASESRRSRSPPRHRSLRDDSSRYERSSRDHHSRRDARPSDSERNSRRDSHSRRREDYDSSRRYSSHRNHSRDSSGSDSRSKARRPERDSHRDRREDVGSRNESSSHRSRSHHDERKHQSSRYNRDEKVYSSDESPSREHKRQESKK